MERGALRFAAPQLGVARLGGRTRSVAPWRGLGRRCAVLARRIVARCRAARFRRHSGGGALGLRPTLASAAVQILGSAGAVRVVGVIRVIRVIRVVRVDRVICVIRMDRAVRMVPAIRLIALIPLRRATRVVGTVWPVGPVP